MVRFLVGKDEEICMNCKYYYPHYVRCEEGFQRIMKGHCSYPRMRDWRRDVDSCHHFEQKEGGAEYMALVYEEVDL